MRRLVVLEFMTVDGVMEAPGFEEHRTGRNGWAIRPQSDELQRHIKDVLDRSDAFLLGRVTYQIWAAFWPTATQTDDEWLRKMNGTPKYVVTNTLRSLEWENSHVLGADWVEQLRALKQQPGGDIVVEGSGQLVAALLEHDLVDELQLLVFPVVLGTGKRLFPDSADLSNLRLTSSQVFPNSVVALTYVPIGPDEAFVSHLADEYVWTPEQSRNFQALVDVDRVLATVLFTDIVASSERAAEIGDRRWRKLLDEHDVLARAEVNRWHGHFVKSTGDGVLATFDTPTRALRCAFGMADELRRHGVEIRAGIHTGEIEMRDDDVGGIGVHIASRVLTEAGSRGESVVVTRTIRDLASGANLTFTPLGTTTLRGIPGEWELFAATVSG